MWKSFEGFNKETPQNENSLEQGAKIALISSAISTFGDALQTIGGAISIEESRISDAQQQQQLKNLQNQIDELRKERNQSIPMTTNIEMLGQLLERLVEQLEMKEGKENEK